MVDRDEITVIGSLAAPTDTASATERVAAAKGRAKAFREQTREQRIVIAREIEERTDRKVSWVWPLTMNVICSPTWPHRS